MKATKYAVLKTYNFDPSTECALFDNYEAACDYLQWLWEDDYNTELAEGLPDMIDEENTWHEEDNAIITWLDACRAEYSVINVDEPRKNYRRE